VLIIACVLLVAAGALVGWRVLEGNSARERPLAEDTGGPAPVFSGDEPLPTPRASIPAGHVPIVMYHYIRINPVASDRMGFVLSVTPNNFATQMKWAYDHGFHTITLSDVYDALENHRAIDSHAMVLTFDDGYEDFYTAALPVLERYNFRATAYIISGFVGRPGYMTWPQIITADTAGMTIGSHTLSHPNLTRQSPARLTAQVQGSKTQLEQHLGHPVVDFCYPSGRYNSTAVAAVRAAGYRDATTTAFAAFESLDAAYYWPRVRISGADDMRLFIEKLLTGVAEYQRYGESPPPRLSVSPSPEFSPSPPPSPPPSHF